MPNKKIALRKEDLPHLREGHVRIVHLTHAPRKQIEEIKRKGLNYESQGMLSSTARYWSSENEVQYSSEDPRFNGQEIKAIVMDIPEKELRLHNDPAKSPGKIPPEYLVGILDNS